MNLQTLTKDLCAYNLWANHELLCQLTDKKQVLNINTKEVNQKLFHLLSVEDNWISKIKGLNKSASEGKIKSLETKSPEEEIFEGAIDALLKDLVIQSENLLNYVADLSEEALKETVEFDTSGNEDKMSRFEMIQHTVGECTYQRGILMNPAHQETNVIRLATVYDEKKHNLERAPKF